MILLKKIWTYLAIVAIALAAAVSYELFVFPNQFAPSGVNGICTMIQYVTGVSVGYLSLLINIPLALWVYFTVSKSLAVRSMLYVVTFSLGLLLLDHVDLSAFAYATANGTYYHVTQDCSGMTGATTITKEAAEEAGKKPCPACRMARACASRGCRKCTSHVATTGMPHFSPSRTIFLFSSRSSSSSLTRPSRTRNSLLPMGWISR